MQRFKIAFDFFKLGLCLILLSFAALFFPSIVTKAFLGTLKKASNDQELKDLINL